MRIELRDVRKTDITIFYVQQNDVGAHQMVGITTHAPDDKIAYFQKWERIFPDENVTKRTILYDGRVAGIINCFYAPWSGKQEVGYWIGREFWSRGIATKALKLFLEIEKRRPLFATSSAHNKASIVVLEKSGFKQTATEKVKLDDGRAIEEFRFELA